MITLIFICLAIGCIASIVYWSWKNKISPMPTSPAAKEALIKALPKYVCGTIVELGSGWGTLLCLLAKSYRRCQIIGYETSPIPYRFSWLRANVLQLPNIALFQQDLFTADLSDAEMVVCYLYPEAMGKLKEKFEKELKPKTWVISNTFAIPDWQEEAIFICEDLYHTKIYLYQTR